MWKLCGISDVTYSAQNFLIADYKIRAVQATVQIPITSKGIPSVLNSCRFWCGISTFSIVKSAVEIGPYDEIFCGNILDFLLNTILYWEIYELYSSMEF